ncbi:MAG TPA: DUF6263 family protein [Tepidisphaeraceae bacterium]|nr:DUF6263 family protein [Tepidisphaeraceae bacterium]
MLRKFSFVLALLLLAHRSALAQTTLEFSYADPIFINVVHTSEADVSLMGQNTKIEMKASFLFKVDTGETEKGVTTCNVTILDCDDTTSANGKSSGKDMLKGLKNQKFEVVISENNQKIELRKTEAASKAIMGAEAAGATAEEKKQAEDMMKEALRIHLAESLIPLPGKPVEKGDKWKHKTSIDMQSLADVSVDREYVFGGEKTEGDKTVGMFEWTSKVDIKPKKAGPDAPPFSITEKPGAVQKNDGTVVWDLEADRPVSVENTQVYSLELSGDMEGQKIKGSIKAEEKFVFTYFDKNPAK